MRSSPLHSPRQAASRGTLSWLGASPEQPAGDNGGMVEVLYGRLVVFGDDTVKRVWLQRQVVLAEL